MGLTPYKFIGTKEPDPFTLNPLRQMRGLNRDAVETDAVGLKHPNQE